MARKSKSDVALLLSAMGVLLSIVEKLIPLLRRRKVSSESIHRLATEEGDNLLEVIADAVAIVLAPVKGAARTVARTLIDMGVPWIPEGFTFEKNSVEGKVTIENIDGDLYVDGRKVVLYLHEKQNSGRITGLELERELEGKSILGTALLRWCLDNPTKVPEKWKGKYLYFWATKLRDSGDYRCVLYLYWCSGQWQWSCRWLGSDFDGQNPALVLEELQISET